MKNFLLFCILLLVYFMVVIASCYSELMKDKGADEFTKYVEDEVENYLVLTKLR